MPSYCAFLGHQPRISLAEISAAVPGMKVQRMIGQMVAVFDTPEEIDQKLLKTWGGTMILAKGVEHDQADKFKKVPQHIADFLAPLKGKVVFSLRCDGVDFRTVHDLYRDSKDALRKIQKPARYVGTDRAPAATVLLHKHDIVSGKHGCEMVLLKDDDWTWVGRTIAAHDPNAYTRRDMNKPARDMHIGLLPPKLAQILMNFGKWLADEKNPLPAGKKKKDYTLYDPFCGSGVIPMECILRGWTVLASDASLKAVNATERNLEWLRKEEKILKRDVPSTTWKHDATKPFELKEMPDMVVTETTLGENLEARATQKEIVTHKSIAEKTEAAFIKNAAATLPGVPLVITLPVWMSSTGPVFMEKIWETIKESGYEPVLPPGVSTDVAIHKSLLYRRPEQFVGRQIVLLRPKA